MISSFFTRAAHRLPKLARAAAMGLALTLPQTAVTPLQAQNAYQDARALEATQSMRLAYVITGNTALDETSRAGLDGLSRFIADRSALEPGAPMAVDLENDELAFFPLIYWAIDPAQPLPSARAFDKLNTFMRFGGTLLIDTRDEGLSMGNDSPEKQYLKEILSRLDIPPMAPVPGDHVLGKTFFLLNNFPGRWSGETLVEALPPEQEGEERPARGDNVSPIIITGNDMAAAWAVSPAGVPLYPVAGQARQREMAYRAGMNIVLWVLTGNYKADQVHVPALLERLGTSPK